MKEQPVVARTQFVPVGGAMLWTQTSGQGRPLVLCHGGPGMSDNLEPLARMVDDLMTVHRFDQRACGRSTGVGQGQTVAGAVADLEALRAHYPRNTEAAAALNQDRVRWLADPTLRRRLRRLAVPALVLHGERDPLPADGAAELARLLPSARLELLPGVGHMPWLEDAAVVRQAVRCFINAIPVG